MSHSYRELLLFSLMLVSSVIISGFQHPKINRITSQVLCYQSISRAHFTKRIVKTTSYIAIDECLFIIRRRKGHKYGKRGKDLDEKLKD